MDILDQYQGILLDMNSTFMFGEDRFGESEDFYATYRNLGGEKLSAEIIEQIIRDCYRGMFRDYEDPASYDDFPSLREGLVHYGGCEAQHIELLTQVFALHEIGKVPPDHAHLLQAWSQTHKLGVVSNIWASKSLCLEEFKRVGIDDIWQTVVFSSDSHSIKPSLSLFHQALNCFDVPISETLFIGDSMRVDMEPVKALGMDTVWITESADEHPMADYMVSSLLDIENMEVV